MNKNNKVVDVLGLTTNIKGKTSLIKEGDETRDRLYTASDLVSHHFFISRLVQAVRKGMHMNGTACIEIVSIEINVEDNVNSTEDFKIIAKIKNVLLDIQALLNRNTGDVWALGLCCENYAYNYQYDRESLGLVGGYSLDGKTFEPEFWLTSVPSNEIEDAMSFCIKYAESNPLISGDWQKIKELLERH